MPHSSAFTDVDACEIHINACQKLSLHLSDHIFSQYMDSLRVPYFFSLHLITLVSTFKKLTVKLLLQLCIILLLQFTVIIVHI